MMINIARKGLRGVRGFSKMSMLEKYSLKQHMKDYTEKKIALLSGSKGTDLLKKEEAAVAMQRPLDSTFYPRQHPQKLDYADTGIISYKPPVRNLAQFYHLPSEAVTFAEEPFESPPNSKEIDACIIGPPNAGKSLLFNSIVGKTVSAVSPKYNTTNDSITGVYTDLNTRSQICLVDTPGAVRIKNNPNSKLLITKAWEAISDCDKVVFVVDSAKHVNAAIRDAVKRLRNTTRSSGETRYLEQLKAARRSDKVPSLTELKKELADIEAIEDEETPAQVPSVLVLNKLDLATKKSAVKALQRELEDLGQFEKTFFISALTGFGVPDLVKYLMENCKSRPWQYNPKTRSLQCEAEKAAEIMRQELYKKYYKNVPYEVGIKIASWVPRSNGELIIDYQLETTTKVQMGILLGKEGRILDEVKQSCVAELCKLLCRPIKIKVNVVAREKLR